MPSQTIRARQLRFIGPVPIDDGCIVIDNGRVTAIGPMSRIKPARVDDEIDGVLMPGLVNYHTHLELSDVNRPEIVDTFQQWILDVAIQVRGDEATFADRRIAAVRAGIAESLRHGVTCVWDISQNVDVVRPVLTAGPIKSISFGECLGIGQRRGRFDQLLDKACDTRLVNEKMSVGLSPHAPYTVDERGYERVFEIAHEHNLPVMTHLAETPDEARFLFDHTGPFADLYAAIGSDPGEPPRFADGPVKWLAAINRRRVPLIAAHCNYCDDNDINILAEMNATVVWCPRTHAYFGHPPHRWREMIERGINVRIGTDSRASSPDLNLVDDLRLAHAIDSSSPGQLWRAACGPCDVGSAADFVVFNTAGDDPLREILETPTQWPTNVWVDGHKIV